MIHMQRAPDRAKLIISIVFIARYSIFHTCIYVPLCTYMYVNDHIYISMCVYVHNPDTLSRNCFRTIATRGNATHSPRRLPRSSPSASPEKSRGTGSPCSARFCGPGGRGGGVGEKRVSAALRGEQSRSVTGARGMEGGNAYSPGQAQLEVHGVREHHEGLVPSVLAAAARGQQHVEHGQTPEEDEDVLGPGAVREAAEARAGEGSQQALERVEGGRGEIRPVGALAEEARVVGVALAGAGGSPVMVAAGRGGGGGGERAGEKGRRDAVVPPVPARLGMGSKDTAGCHATCNTQRQELTWREGERETLGHPRKLNVLQELMLVQRLLQTFMGRSSSWRLSFLLSCSASSPRRGPGKNTFLKIDLFQSEALS